MNGAKILVYGAGQLGSLFAARLQEIELQHLADEFLALARTTSVPTPTIDRLYPHLDPDTPLMPEGSAEIPLDWRGVWIGLGALTSALAGLALVLNLIRKKRR